MSKFQVFFPGMFSNFKMIAFVVVAVVLSAVDAQRPVSKGIRYNPVPYYNFDSRTGNGLGLLQDLSHAKILSNEPFIISFEFPKVVGGGGGLGDSRKSSLGAKRSKSQRKRNRRLRQFRHIVLPEGDQLERRKRFPINYLPSNYQTSRTASLVKGNGNRALHKLQDGTIKSTGILGLERLLGYKMPEREPAATESSNEFPTKEALPRKSLLDDILNATKKNFALSEVAEKGMIPEGRQKNWEKIKDLWDYSFSDPKIGTENEVENNEEDLVMAKTKKMWANCQLLKLLKVPQKNPYFYKLLPPNYPALIMNEEKQYRCKDIYNYADLARDKKMILDKIEQLEKILSGDFGSEIWRSGLHQKQTEEESKKRRKRSVEQIEAEGEPEKKNTIQDESLQGKLEGEIRSDRSMRTKTQPKNLLVSDRRETGNEHKAAIGHHHGKLKKKKPQRNLDLKSRRRKANPPNMREKKEGRSSDDKDKSNVEPEVERSRRHNVHQDLKMRGEIERENSEDVAGKLKVDKNSTGIKPERQDVKKAKEVLFQDIFAPSEVNKIVKQKEVEANIFDKVVRAMRKYEDDPNEGPVGQQKRESRNEAEAIMENFENKLNATGENDSWELEDTIKKLAKIFKMLGVANEAKKKKNCEGCDESEEESIESEENFRENGLKLRKALDKTKKGKASKPCTCPVKEDECPICHNCVKCFRECRKSHGVVSKIQRGSDSADAESRDSQEYPGLDNEKVETFESKMSNLSKDSDLLAKALMQSGGKNGDTSYRHNDLKTERMYRSKLPPTRDMVRVYFDNPENKLLVWTKRGRRTMPWGPLTTDLQLYRDRAKQILKSAEDILQRIKETEKKIHSPESYDENKSEGLAADNNKHINDAEDILKIIKEDEPNILTTAWTNEIEKSNETDTDRVSETAQDKERVLSRLLSGISEEQVSGEAPIKGIFDENNDDENLGVTPSVDETEGHTSAQADSEVDGARVKTEDGEERKRVSSEEKDVDDISNEPPDFKDDRRNEKEEMEYVEQIYADNMESQSVEAAVEPIEGKLKEIEKQEKQAKYNSDESHNDTSRKSDEVGSGHVLTEESNAEEKDIPARVEAVQKEKEDEEINKEAILASTEDDYYFKYEEDSEENAETSSSHEDIHDTKLEAMKSVDEGKSSESRSVRTSSEENIFVEKQELGRKEESVAGEEMTMETKLSNVAPQDAHDVAKLVDSEGVSGKNTWSESAAGSYEDSELEDQSKEENLEYIQSSEHEKEKVQSAKIESIEENSKVRETLSDEVDKENHNEELLGIVHQEENNDEKIFEERIKPMEDDYHGKGKAQQTMGEKEAMLSALMNVEKANEKETEDSSPPKKKEEEENRSDQVSRAKKFQEEEGKETTEKETAPESEDPERNSFKTFINHIVNGKMDVKDLEVVKSLEESQIDSLIEELQENDKNTSTTNCGTKLKLCQAACGCDKNGTSTELGKYDIIRGFLSWLKGVQLDRMIPISI